MTGVSLVEKSSASGATSRRASASWGCCGQQQRCTSRYVMIISLGRDDVERKAPQLKRFP